LPAVSGFGHAEEPPRDGATDHLCLPMSSARRTQANRSSDPAIPAIHRERDLCAFPSWLNAATAGANCGNRTCSADSGCSASRSPSMTADWAQAISQPARIVATKAPPTATRVPTPGNGFRELATSCTPHQRAFGLGLLHSRASDLDPSRMPARNRSVGDDSLMRCWRTGARQGGVGRLAATRRFRARLRPEPATTSQNRAVPDPVI